MTHDDVLRWVAAYERLWRTAGTDDLDQLFAPEARYRVSPWAPELQGLGQLRRLWDEGRDGPDEQFALAADVVALEGQTAVVRLAVDYADGPSWRDLWVLRFDGRGRVVAFEEWPFAPDQQDGHDEPVVREARGRS